MIRGCGLCYCVKDFFCNYYVLSYSFRYREYLVFVGCIYWGIRCFEVEGVLESEFRLLNVYFIFF